MDRGPARDEASIGHQLAMQRDIGLNAFHDHFGKRNPHASDRLLSGVAICDHFGNQGIIVGRDDTARIDMGVNPDTRPTGWMPRRDPTRARGEFERILCVDPAFDGMATWTDIALTDAQAFPKRNADLLLNDVVTCNEFGDWVFNLYPCVHFNEVELSVFVEEFEGAGTAVANLAASVRASGTDSIDQSTGDPGRWRFLDHLLVAALHRAVALAQMNRIAVLIRQHLDLDMAGVFEKFFEIDRRVRERRVGLLTGRINRIHKRGFRVDDAHAAAAAAARRFDDDRIADRARDLDDLPGVFG